MTGDQPTAGDWSPGPPARPIISTDWRAAAGTRAAPPLIEPLPAAVAVRVLLLALVGGVAAQYLFVDQRLGINVLLWVAIVLGAAWLLRRPDAQLERSDGWLPLAALAFAGFVWLRDETALHAFDLLAAGVLTLASALALGGTTVTRRAFSSLAPAAVTAVALVATGGAALTPGLDRVALGLKRQCVALRVARGLLVALPLVVVFVVLFSAADSVFAAHLQAIFGLQVDVSELLYRLLFAAAAAWLLAGTVVCAWLAREKAAAVSIPAGVSSATARRPLGDLEGIVVLLALDLLFGFFVVLQAAYLFGGLDTLEVSGMTYSEYARRGFFELTVVGLLAGAVLLAVDGLIERKRWPYRAAAVGLAALTGAVLVSAVVRLGLYQQAYGWTELRLFALAAIGWLGVGIVATATGLLTDRATLVPRALVGLALAVAVVVNLVGPQSFVATQNLQRVIDPSLVPADGRSGVDFDYLNSLGYDAVPAVAAALPQLSGEHRADADLFLRRQAAALAREAPELGWPSWNLARDRASEALVSAGYLVPGR